MPDYVEQALNAEGLRHLFNQRPWYQRNGCLGWIDRAKREDTRMRRLQQTPDELRAGDVYMKVLGDHRDS